MSKIVKLLPIILAALMAMACFSLINTAVETNSEYNGYIEKAREAAKKDISYDVEQYYSAAIDMKSSVKLYLEWGQYYVDHEYYDAAAGIGETIIKEFPKDAKGYEFLLESYLRANDYSQFFKEYEHAKKIGAKSDKLDELYAKSKYLFDIKDKDMLEVFPFSSSMSRYTKDNDEDEYKLYGYVDESGSVAISPEYLECGDFNGDEVSIAPVVDMENKAYYIDKNGNRRVVIQPENITVKSLGMYSGGIVPVFDGTNYYMCDKDSKVIAGPFKFVSTFNGDVGVIQDDQGWKIVNNKGKVLSDTVFDGFVLDEKNVPTRQDVFFAIKNGKYFLVNKNGKQVSSEPFDDARMFVDSYAAVMRNGKWGFIDSEGKVVVDFKFDEARSFSGGYAPVMSSSSWGYAVYNEKAKDVDIVIDYQFEDALCFSPTGNAALVMIDGKWQVLTLFNSNK